MASNSQPPAAAPPAASISPPYTSVTASLAVSSASAPAAGRAATAFLDLLLDIRALIISKATHDAARNLASTSSSALQAVLEARTDLKAFTVHRALARSIARLRFNPVGKLPSCAKLWCKQERLVFSVYLPLHTLPLTCAEQHAGASTCANAVYFSFSPAAIASVTRVDAQTKRDGSPRPTFSLPSGMDALTEVRVVRCKLQEGWLPRSSRGSVRSLHLERSHVQCIPKDMAMLAELRVLGTKYRPGNELAHDWLPESSRQRVRILDVRNTTIRSIPAGVSALEAAQVISCERLADEWLPASSKRRVRMLIADDTFITSIPAGMSSLETLSVSGCKQLSGTWLTADSAALVRSLYAASSNISSMPAGMAALEAVDVSRCRLHAEWLPASSSAHVRSVLAADCTMQGLEGMPWPQLPHGVQLGQGVVKAVKCALVTFWPVPS